MCDECQKAAAYYKVYFAVGSQGNNQCLSHETRFVHTTTFSE